MCQFSINYEGKRRHMDLIRKFLLQEYKTAPGWIRQKLLPAGFAARIRVPNLSQPLLEFRALCNCDSW